MGRREEEGKGLGGEGGERRGGKKQVTTH